MFLDYHTTGKLSKNKNLELFLVSPRVSKVYFLKIKLITSKDGVKLVTPPEPLVLVELMDQLRLLMPKMFLLLLALNLHHSQDCHLMKKYLFLQLVHWL